MLAHRTFQLGQGNRQIPLSLHLYGARFRQSCLRAQHIQLSSCTGFTAGVGEAQGLFGPFEDFLLGFQNFLRFGVVRVCGAHFQFYLARRVFQFNLRLLRLGIGLVHFALGQQAIENIPAHLRTDRPAMHTILQIIGKHGVVDSVTGEGLQTRLVAAFGVDDPLVAEAFALGQHGEFRTLGLCLGHGLSQIQGERRHFHRATQLKRQFINGALRPGLAKQVGQVVFGNPEGVARTDQFRFGVGEFHFGAQQVEPGHGTGIKAAILVFQFTGQ